MKSRDLIEALLAVLGVYEVLQGLRVVAFIIPYGDDAAANSWSALPIVANAVIPIVLGAALLWMRADLADYLAPRSDDVASAPTESLLETLLAVAGVYFVVSALATGSAIVSSEYLQADFVRELIGHPARPDEVWPPRIRVIVQIALGIALAVGRRGLAAAITAVRAAGSGRMSV